MESYRKIQDMLLFCLEEMIDEEEFVLLFDAYNPPNLSFLHSAYVKFSLGNKDPTECKAGWKRGIFLSLFTY